MNSNGGHGVTTNDHGIAVGSGALLRFLVSHHSASAFTGVDGLSEPARAWRRFSCEFSWLFPYLSLKVHVLIQGRYLTHMHVGLARVNGKFSAFIR